MSVGINLEEKNYNKLVWSLITVLLIVTVFMILFNYIKIIDEMQPVVTTLLIFAIVALHGTKRYGLKNMVAFFLITWIVSCFFEALSLQTGFPFGLYDYVLMEGPRIFGVPVMIMFAYFSIGYLSWMLSHVIAGQYAKRLDGKQIFIVPLIATFIMVMWDLTMDPIASTVQKLWIWANPGPYYGVPISNYFGWFLVVFIIFQLFALYLTRFDNVGVEAQEIFTGKPYWLAIPIIYLIQDAYGIINLIAPPETIDLYLSMGLIAVFTTLFVTLIAIVTVTNNTSLR